MVMMVRDGNGPNLPVAELGLSVNGGSQSAVSPSLTLPHAYRNSPPREARCTNTLFFPAA